MIIFVIPLIFFCSFISYQFSCNFLQNVDYKLRKEALIFSIESDFFSRSYGTNGSKTIGNHRTIDYHQYIIKVEGLSKDTIKLNKVTGIVSELGWSERENILNKTIYQRKIKDSLLKFIDYIYVEDFDKLSKFCLEIPQYSLTENFDCNNNGNCKQSLKFKKEKAINLLVFSSATLLLVFLLAFLIYKLKKI